MTRRSEISAVQPGLILRASVILLLARIAFFTPPLSAQDARQPIGWSSLGTMPAPQWDNKTLLFRSSQGMLALTPLSDDVVRVRFTTNASFGRDHSYAVVNRAFGESHVIAEIGPNAATVTTASLKITAQYAPLRITFATRSGEVLDADDPERGISRAGSEFRVAKILHADEHVYGFGEKTGRLDKRGWRLGGYNYAMWNSDTPAYDSSTDPLYVTVPFFMVSRHGRTHGIFLDNTWRSFFDVGREQQNLLTFGAEGGDIDYYFIAGPDPKQVLERYSVLTGRMPLPPLWALGYHQCRWSYYPESRVRLLASNFREKKVPADVIWLDIHYQDGYKPFTWDHQRFPDPGKMIADLRAEGFRIVCIVDPHPQALEGYEPYDTGVAGNHFVKRPDGTVFKGKVWPSNAERQPGPSVFPDFTRPATREWWGGLYRSLLDLGVAGIWNDMNEPSVFDQATGTMPLDLIFDNEGQPTTHREVHNVYGQQMSRATYESLGRLRPNDRAFVLTRSTFAGGQRYAAVWAGDNTADWASLRQSIPTLLGMGLSGLPFVGSDISGFVGPASGELYTRWLQTGVFYPFMRSHTELGTPDKEPWAFGNRFEAINRRAIELRYELLPCVYNVMRQSSESGVPALRPLFLEYPADEHAATIDDEFLFGSDLLAAPVLHEGANRRDVYLPKGEWYDYWTGRHYAGGATIHIPVTLDSIPLFVRGGAFIFRQPIVQNTDQMPGNPLRILVAPAAQSEASLYEDDGHSLEFRRGNYMVRRFRQTGDDRSLTIDVSAPEGSYRPKKRALMVELWMPDPPKSVLIQPASGTAQFIPRRDGAGLPREPRGWSFTDGKVTIKGDDAFESMRFTVQR